MTRIFDALRKAQTAERAAAAPLAPVPPSPAPAPHAGPSPPALVPHAAPGPFAPVGRPGSATIASAAAPSGFAGLPAIETVAPSPLSEDVARELTMLRIRLEGLFEGRGSRVILFLSSQPGEGTSTVAAEFALLLAAEGRQRVLLADLHARRPALARRFGLEPGARTGARRPHPRSGEEPRLAVLPIDERAARQGSLHPATVRDRIASVSNLYDWVILDGPPVLESPDSVEIAALADGVVMVVRSGIAKRPVVARAVELLRRGGARVLGTVLNRRRDEIPEFLYRRV